MHNVILSMSKYQSNKCHPPSIHYLIKCVTSEGLLFVKFVQRTSSYTLKSCEPFYVSGKTDTDDTVRKWG